MHDLDEGDFADDNSDNNNATACTPFVTKWIVPLIMNTVESKPNLSSLNLCHISFCRTERSMPSHNRFFEKHATKHVSKNLANFFICEVNFCSGMRDVAP